MADKLIRGTFFVHRNFQAAFFGCTVPDAGYGKVVKVAQPLRGQVGAKHNEAINGVFVERLQILFVGNPA